MFKVISTVKAPAAIGPYSQGFEVNGIVYTSGQIPVNPATGEIPEGIEAQAEQVMENVKNLLESAGTSMANVIKTTVFIKDMASLPRLMKFMPDILREIVRHVPVWRLPDCRKMS